MTKRALVAGCDSRATPSASPASLAASIVLPSRPFTSIPHIEKRNRMAKSSPTFNLPLIEGELVVWGDNDKLQITEAPKPSTPFWKVVPGGATQCLSIRMDGIPVLWGNGPVSRPLTLPKGAQYIDGALGVTHAYLLRSDGRIDTAGEFAVANLASGNKIADVPPALEHLRFIAVTAGGGFGLAIDADGVLQQWGGDLPGPPYPTGAKFTQIRARNDYCVALDQDGHLYAWGTSDLLSSPALLPGWIKKHVGLGSEAFDYWFHPDKFTAIAAGAMGKIPSYPPHILAIRNDGTIAAWGDNTYGQVSDVPTMLGSAIFDGPRTRFRAVAAGKGYSLALDDNGNIHHWGLKASPTNPNGLANVPQGPFASIGAGTMQATAIRANRSPPLFAKHFSRGTDKADLNTIDRTIEP